MYLPKERKMMKLASLIAMMIMITLNVTLLHSEVVEEIYAVINEETITFTEYRNAENSMIQQLQSQYKGEALQKAIQKMKSGLMNQLIEHKLILSKAKEKNYDVENEIKMIIEEIKKQNNLKTDEDLRRALQTEGITMDEFKRQQKVVRMQQRMIYEEITSKINIDSPEIMEYYKSHVSEYTKPLELSLNCIFLKKEYYFDKQTLLKRRNEISEKLKIDDFKTVAEEYTELEGVENKLFLGNFKQGELDQHIEKAALELKPNQHSTWIETDSGWYIIQLINKKEPELVEYEQVREKIKNKLLLEKQEVELQKYIKKLKKESYIKIYKKID
jgi:parvulin-like peptidyl-prolyl isomerase